MADRPPPGYSYLRSEFHPFRPGSKFGWAVTIYKNSAGKLWAVRKTTHLY